MTQAKVVWWKVELGWAVRQDMCHGQILAVGCDMGRADPGFTWGSESICIGLNQTDTSGLAIAQDVQIGLGLEVRYTSMV